MPPRPNRPLTVMGNNSLRCWISTAAGKIGGQELFYIMSRGFSKKEAEKLIIRANFNELIEGLQNEQIKEDIIHQIEYRL